MTKDKVRSTEEALKLALEALKGLGMKHFESTGEVLYKETFTAIKEALSSCQCPECRLVLHASDCAVHSEPAYPKGECNCGAQPAVTESHKQEPVAFVKGCNRGQWEIFPAKAYQIFEREQPLYTTTPQRKPLTDEEIILIVAECASSHQHTDIHLARAIEQAHGIKELKEYKK